MTEDGTYIERERNSRIEIAIDILLLYRGIAVVEYTIVRRQGRKRATPRGFSLPPPN
jgi:hypothetical protein